MSITDDIKSALKYVEPAIATIETIQKITGTGGLPAEEALAAIDAAIKTFINGAAGDVTPASILADLAALTQGEADDDAAADAALKAKFPAGAP